MEKDIANKLSAHGWKSRPPASLEEIEQLKGRFPGELPADYLGLLKWSNGGSMYGFATPLIIFSISEVIAHHKEGDLYRNIPDSLIFGGDGGGTIYCFDLRSSRAPVMIVREDTDGYEDRINEATSLEHFVDDIISGKKMN